MLRIFFTWFTMLLASYSQFSIAASDVCHPINNIKLPQYIIGYGSLMDTTSKKRTFLHTGENIPVNVQGYKRGWFAKGVPIGFSATFLAVSKDNHASMNAIVFALPSQFALAQYDQRELSYCRELVPLENIQSLISTDLPKAQFWIYVPKEEFIAKPSEKFPILQSYVDIFLSGCLTLEKKYHLKNFVEDCIDTTHDWSAFWINDRLYPRRPFEHQPNALLIDTLLAKRFPELVANIKIE